MRLRPARRSARARGPVVLAAALAVSAGACGPTDGDDAADGGGDAARDTATVARDAPDSGAADTAASAPDDPGVTGAVCRAPDPAPRSGTRAVEVWFRCEDGPPGGLHPVERRVDADRDPVEAALAELLRGPTGAERARGFRSHFSGRTEGMLREVSRSPGGDTVRIDFRDFRDELPEGPATTSFLPPGIMADLTWTVFRQFPEVEAVRLSFEGDEGVFWSWLAGEPREPEVFSRRDWERI